MKKTRLAVYSQRKPIPTGEVTYKDGMEIRWHEANLVLVGMVETWEQAKQLTAAPIVENVTEWH